MTASERDAIDRRRVLQATGASALTAIAGCVGGDEGSAEGDGNDGSDADPEPVDVADDAAWRTASLTDVTTGDSFSVREFDRPAIVHTFARGCAACHAQQTEFADLYASREGDVEIVDLTIDPKEDSDDVQEYADADGFSWRFGTPTEQVISSLVDDFGREVTVSASSPVVIVCPGGDVYRLDKVVDADPLASVLEQVC